MTFDIVHIFLYFIFEFLLFFTSIRLIFLITKNSQKEIHKSELVTLWLISTIILSISIASLFSFLHFNGELQYMLSALTILIISHIDKKINLKNYYKEISSLVVSFIDKFLNWKAIVVFSLVLPVILFVIRPIDEADSSQVLNYMFDWLLNETNPYIITARGPGYWELAYLPSLVITNNDSFFWITSFKPFFIIVTVSYLVGRAIGLPNRLNWFTVFSCSMFFILWFRTSGVSTLKADLLLGAGVILFAFAILRVMRGDFNRTSLVFFLSGIIFVLAKWNGLAILFCSIILLILFNKNKILFEHKKFLLIIPIGIAVVFLTSGHYYVENLIEFGHPLASTMFETRSDYVFKDLANTSIFSNLNNEKMYEYLLYYEPNIKRAGFLFSAIVLFGFIGTLGTLFYFTRFYFKTKHFESNILFLSIFILLGWLIFLITPLSAGPKPDDFWHIETFNTLRYAVGTIILTEVFFVYFLWKIRIPQLIIFGIISINLVSRLVSFYWQIYPYLDLSFIIYPIIVSIIILLLKNSLSSKAKVSIIISLMFLIFVFAPTLVDQQRDTWHWYWNDVIMEVYYLPSSTIALLEEPPRPWSLPPKHPFYGNNFQHTVIHHTEESLLEILQESDNLETKELLPDYIVILCNKHLSCNDHSFEMSLEFSIYSYKEIFLGKRGIILASIENFEK
ncbi:MAG: hypothetical protein K5790_09505 [Nitrosopumilus sp.]|uniref:hypothetical protein n=1 Tax=Nitrosopumilus sp. TaxID=2024843 RepID=UPI00247BE0C2|nr:hypothetical protein [Nitrosopumilus sp.]MCV0393506.1 hypothetical protein [Nitrosopumilus sp.]